MCGIAGVLPAASRPAPDPDVVEAMCRTLAHRGPDDWGVALGNPTVSTITELRPHVTAFPSATPVAFAHTRLSVLDLTSAGHQPMASDDGRVWLVYNGEVYNFRELRATLESRGCRFKSQTDTEVILRLYEQEGIDCVARLNGMFALAIWDGRQQQLLLARDRFGIKPLYYAWTSAGLVFASELKALLAAGVSCSIDLNALDRYLSFLSVPEPDTILKDVKKLPPGHYMRVHGGKPELRQFWRLSTTSAAHVRNENDAAEAVLERLTTAVSRQSVADVPVGAFLSGGLDSSAIVSLMVRTGRPPACVHSIGFSRRDQQYERDADDLRYAGRLAAQLQVRQEQIVLQSHVADLLPTLVWHLDEPIADPAIIPMYQICRAAKRYTKVLLSGMGADELFGGYRRHATHDLLATYSTLPSIARRTIATCVDRLPSAGAFPWVSSIRHAQKLMRLSRYPAGESYIQACTWIDPDVKAALYSPALRRALNGADADGRHRAALADVRAADPVTQMLYLDTQIYLPSHNLNYTDKMSMAASLEVRVPFLDNDLVDLAFQLPSSLKLKRLQGKYILKKALADVLPRPILTRRKSGFAAPIRSWLVGDLRDMVRDLLSPDHVARRGLFNPAAVSAMLTEQDRGRRDHSYQLWALLTLELWMQAYHDAAPHRVAA